MGALWDKIGSGPARAGEDLKELKASGLPVVLYGDGWYAPYLREYLARRGLSAAAVFTDAGFTASGAAVSFDEVNGRFGRFNIVIAFANSRLAREKLARLDLARVAGVYFFDVMGELLNNTFGRAYLEAHKAQFGAAYELLADDLSRETCAAFINSKLGGPAEALADVSRKEQYFPKDIMELSDREVFVDGGAYTGDTLLTFMRLTGGRCERCCAFEPEPANAVKLKATVEKRGLRGVTVFNKGLWSSPATLPFAVWHGTSASAVSGEGEVSVEAETVDRAAPDATFIKLDIEGAELEALKGAAETIKRNRPKLAVCVYHKPGDLFEIPLFLRSLAPEYRFYLRQHQPVACETVLYAVV
ncbi:MAG: FkbM family methyltransferase [Elusimicrobiales bacterium]|nr:FkbM family methyltransferase [Elusimicrobiales bacterium]